MGDDNALLHKKNDENFDLDLDIKNTFYVESTDNSNQSLSLENINYPANFPFSGEYNLFSQVMTDGLSSLLSTLGKQLFVFLKERITARYGKAKLIRRFIFKAGMIFLSNINTPNSGGDAFLTLFNDEDFRSLFSKEPQFQGEGIDKYFLLLIKLILIWNDLRHIRQQPIKILLRVLPRIVSLLREDLIIAEWNRTQAMEWASVIDAALPWINFYHQQAIKPSTNLGEIISDLYEKRQDLLPGWINQLVDRFESLFREIKEVLNKVGGYLADYETLTGIANKIDNSHTLGDRVSNVFQFYTQYDENKAQLLNKLKPDLSPETQRFLNEWQAAHEIKQWFSAEVKILQDPVSALKSLETLTDPQQIAQLRTKTLGTQSG